MLRKSKELIAVRSNSEGHNDCSALPGRGEEAQLETAPGSFSFARRQPSIQRKLVSTRITAGECKLLVEVTVQLTKRDAIILSLFVLFISFSRYITGAKVTRIW
jgi:hypothetical protein